MSYNINKAITIAKAEINYLEKATNAQLDSKTANAGYNNYSKYARDIDALNILNGPKQGYDWCAIFFLWCLYKAYGKDALSKLLYGLTYAAGCTATVGYYKKADKFFKEPKKGDQIFFKGSDGNPCHTGIVIKVDKNYVYTIEGNTSSAQGVVANGGCVAEKKYLLTSSYIYGYGRPNYGPQTSTKPTLDKKGFKKGSESNGVLCLKQLLLRAYDSGLVTTRVSNTNEFGTKATKVVNQLLKKWNYKQNGIAGERFIKKLGNAVRKESKPK